MRLLILLIAALSFVVAGAFIVIVEKTTQGALIGWTSIVFFGGGALVFVMQLFDTRPRVIIDDRGIFDRRLKIGVIEWHDVADAYVKRIHGNAFVCIALRDPMKYAQRFSPMLRRLASVNRALGFTDISLNLAGTDLDAEQVRELILKEVAVRKGAV